MNMVKAMRETLALARSRDMNMQSSSNPELDFPHLEAMLLRMEQDDNPQGGTFSEGKLGRWLGWAQAAVCAAGCGTLEEMKQINIRCKE
jgi:hypothetical protein